jgi:hypothetical protein
MTIQRMLFVATLLLSGSLAWAGSSRAGEPGDTQARKGPIHQLRVYEMVENNRDAFHRRFRDHALRIMKRHDFDVLATWESESDGRTEFVYLLQWPDQATKERRWADFMADEEWAAIKRQSVRELDGPIMGGILEDKTLVPTGYSPRRTFAPAAD